MPNGGTVLVCLQSVSDLKQTDLGRGSQGLCRMEPQTGDDGRAPSLASRHGLAYGRDMQNLFGSRAFDLNWNASDAKGRF